MNNNDVPILSIRQLRKNFGDVQALGGIDLTLDGAGVYGFLGPNGAGKTTTFKLISGLLSPTSGSIRLCGIDLHDGASRAMKHLGVLLDSPAYYPYLTGEENLEVFARWSGKRDDRKIRDLLCMVGLDNAAKRKVGGYSWGMKRRLGIAAALMDDPGLLLLDEPTNGLDPSGIADIRKLIPRLAYDNKCAVFLSSHRMEEVDQICEKITIINKGEIIAAGSVGELSRAEPYLEVTVNNAAEAKEILLRSPGIKGVEHLGAGRVRIDTGGISPPEINRVLIGGGMEVRQILEKRESLEEIFFRLTGMTGNDE
ncbi:MAG: ABC transporter ATP-binding protein [Candidatus Krumholzibacteriota bacterium]|nr:ABC transporter ATP-binding protein [Candidatus Krumholzibacteriota bacterium]